MKTPSGQQLKDELLSFLREETSRLHCRDCTVEIAR